MKVITNSILTFIVCSSALCFSMESIYKMVGPIKLVARARLHVAAANGDLAAFKNLLQNYTSVDLLDLEGNTPLRAAAQNGHYTICAWLIKQGADTSLHNRQNQTAYDIRAKKGRLASRIRLETLLMPDALTR